VSSGAAWAHSSRAGSLRETGRTDRRCARGCTQLEGSVLCVNPGRLTKGTSAGTFVHVHIHPATDGAADGAELAARTRVEVLRV
jgi:hypothetical protein